MEQIEQTEAKAEVTEANAEGSKLVESDLDAAKANAQTDVSEAINDRLLKESKAWKVKAMEASKELERLKEAEKKKQGKYQEIAEEYKQKLDTLEKKILKQKIETALVQAAPKYGYAGKSFDTLLKLGDHNLLQYDETTEEIVGVDTYIETLKKTEPTLFRNVEAKINDKAPSMQSMVGKKTPSTWDEKYNDLKQKLSESLGKQ